jgi:hypothetical protein
MAGKRDHGDGGIDERGEDRWRLRWRVGGKRYTKSLQGTKRAAQTELRRLLKSADDGQHVAPDKITLADYLRGWLDGDTGLSPKTLERYRQLAEQQIIPYLGATLLQSLRPAQIAYSGERDQPFRLKVITDSGDRDHAVHGPRGPA